MAAGTRSKLNPILVAVERSRMSTRARRSLVEITLDRYRAFVFPNRVREQRYRSGFLKLMPLSNRLPEIPYIRLSKIERGEVFARADELIRIGRALNVAPEDLLVDVDSSKFDIATWAAPFQDTRPWNDADERNAVLLGAALKVRRHHDRALTIAALDQAYGLPPVILSRLENAQKTLGRWNDATLGSLYRLFDVGDAAMLEALITEQYLLGELDVFVELVANPATRLGRSRQRIGELRAALLAGGRKTRAERPSAPFSKAIAEKPAQFAAPALAAPTADLALPYHPREICVYGAPLPGGIIAFVKTDSMIEAPLRAGPRAFGLRVCRATLGAGLPANAVVIVDPDQVPTTGGIAAVRTGEGYRLVTVTFDRTGTTMGYSVTPDVAINIDELDPENVARIIGAVFP